MTQLNFACQAPAETVLPLVLQMRTPIGKTFGPTVTLLLSKPTTFHVTGLMDWPIVAPLKINIDKKYNKFLIEQNFFTWIPMKNSME